MGEYLNDRKLGTCENMYYTTFQKLSAWKVPLKERDTKEMYLNPEHGWRYRFPFNDEVELEVGDDGEEHNFHRVEYLPVPKDWWKQEDPINHSMVGRSLGEGQQRMYVSHPCPFDPKFDTKIMEVGYQEEQKYIGISQQKLVEVEVEAGNYHLMPVFDCPYCGAKFRMDFNDVTSLVAYWIGMIKDGNVSKLALGIIASVMDGLEYRLYDAKMTVS
jgi:hypothetical protein